MTKPILDRLEEELHRMEKEAEFLEEIELKLTDGRLEESNENVEILDVLNKKIVDKENDIIDFQKFIKDLEEKPDE